MTVIVVTYYRWEEVEVEVFSDWSKAKAFVADLDADQLIWSSEKTIDVPLA